MPYGYTVTVWTSGMSLAHERGMPSVGELFLFMIGAVAAFAILGVVVGFMHGVPFEPSAGAVRRAGMLHFVAVGAALGAATLVAFIQSGVAWPLGAFAATATYLELATIELALIGPTSLKSSKPRS